MRTEPDFLGETVLISVAGNADSAIVGRAAMGRTAISAAGLLVLMSSSIVAGLDLPPEIEKLRDAAVKESCENETPVFGAGFIRAADFNGDGRPDYVIDGNGLDCKGGYNRNCGSGGCAVDVYLSTPAGAYRSAGLQQLGGQSSISRAGGRVTLVLPGRHGTSRFRWNGRGLVAAD